MTTAKTLQITLNGVETDSIPVVDGWLQDGAYGFSAAMPSPRVNFDYVFHLICESIHGLNASGSWSFGQTRVEWKLE